MLMTRFVFRCVNSCQVTRGTLRAPVIPEVGLLPATDRSTVTTANHNTVDNRARGNRVISGQITNRYIFYLF